jgi:hypothetical protein
MLARLTSISHTLAAFAADCASALSSCAERDKGASGGAASVWRWTRAHLPHDVPHVGCQCRHVGLQHTNAVADIRNLQNATNTTAGMIKCTAGSHCQRSSTLALHGPGDECTDNEHVARRTAQHGGLRSPQPGCLPTPSTSSTACIPTTRERHLARRGKRAASGRTLRAPQACQACWRRQGATLRGFQPVWRSWWSCGGPATLTL